jgi:hypothetical protein
MYVYFARTAKFDGSEDRSDGIVQSRDNTTEERI